MGRARPNRIRIIALITALVFVHGCKEREQLEREAPALAHADLTVDRIAIAGVVSDVATLGDAIESRESWSLLIGDHLGRERFGRLPIVSCGEVQAILGSDDYGVMLDRFKVDGECDSVILADLHTALEGKARFIAFGNIQEDRIERSQSDVEIVDKKDKTTTKTRTMMTSRMTVVRLRVYDLNDQRLAWDHLTVGQSSRSKDHDMSDFIEHDPKEGFISSMVKSIVNSSIKPDPDYPATPELERSLSNAFDTVGEYLKPSKKRGHR